MQNLELVVLRLIHVLGGIFWVGGILFMAGFLAPALGTIGPAAGQVMGALRRRRLMLILPVVAVLTILSGIALLWRVSRGFSPEYMSSGAGRVYAIAGGAGIVAFALGLLVGRPSAARAAQLAGSFDATPAEERGRVRAEMARLQRRSTVSSAIVTALLIVAAGGMSIARYVP